MGLENPPARILPDRQWESAKYWDTANNSQKSFREWMERLPAGLIMARVEKVENEGKKGHYKHLQGTPIRDYLPGYAGYYHSHGADSHGATMMESRQIRLDRQTKREVTWRRSCPGKLARWIVRELSLGHVSNVSRYCSATAAKDAADERLSAWFRNKR
jgi:hypothetical protein